MKTTLTGVIQHWNAGESSNSEHKAVVLREDDGRIFLLRFDSPLAGDHTSFDPFVGKRVSINGEILPAIFMLDSLDDITVHAQPSFAPAGPAP